LNGVEDLPVIGFQGFVFVSGGLLDTVHVGVGRGLGGGGSVGAAVVDEGCRTKGGSSGATGRAPPRGLYGRGGLRPVDPGIVPGIVATPPLGGTLLAVLPGMMQEPDVT